MAENAGAPSAGAPAPGTHGMPVPGSRVAGYVVEERVGVGGMAVVYRARDEVLGRLVAVKVLSPALAADEEFRVRFLRESRAVAAVDEPHIVPVYGAGEADGLLYIASRFVAGGDLTRLQRAAGEPLAPARAADLVSQVAAALDAAHATGLVHRDVKPGNILVERLPGRPEHAYLSDFGLSKSTSSTTGLTATGRFMGTPDYCAPEQITGEAVDGRADQYSLACVGFSLLAGAVPFSRADTLAVLFAHVNSPAPSVTAVRPDLPPVVDAVLAKAMAKHPAARYESCGAFAQALRGALGFATPAFQEPQAASLPAVTVAALPGYQETATAGRPGQADTAVHGSGATSVQAWRPWDSAAPAGGAPSPRGAGTTAAPDGTRPWPPGQDPVLPGPGKAPARDRRPSRRKARLIAGSAVAAVLAAAGAIAGVALSGQHGGAASASLVATLAAPGGAPMSDAFFSADGRYVAAAGTASDAYVWNAVTRQRPRVLSVAANDRAQPVGFSPDDRTLYVMDATDDQLYDLDIATGQALHRYFLPAGVTWGDTWDSSVLGVVKPDGAVGEYTMATGRLYAQVRNPGTSPVEAVRPDGDGRFILISDEDGLSYLVSAPSGDVVGTFRYRYAGAATVYPAISLNGSTVYVPGGPKGAAKLWDRATDSYVTPGGAGWPVPDNGVNFSTDGTFVVTSPRAASDLVDTWDVATRAHVATVTVPGSGNEELLSVSPGAAEILATGPDNAGKQSFSELSIWRVPR